MGMIHIEGVDDALLEQIAVLARLSGRSVEEEVRALLESAAGAHDLFSAAERQAEADRIRAMTPKGRAQTDSTEIVRALREEGYAGH